MDLDLVLISMIIDDDILALSVIYKQTLANDVFNYIKQNSNNIAIIISNKNIDVDVVLNKSISFLNKHGKKHYRELIKHLQFSNIYTIILTLNTDNVIKIRLREDYGKDSSLTIPISTPTWNVNDLPERIREDLHTLIIDPIIVHADYAPHGIIIVGPPGVGKSVTAEALANALGKKVVRINPGVYRSMWYGMTEKILSSIFSSLRKRKDIVVLIDDADFLVSRFNAIHEAFIAEMNIWLNILQERQRPLVIMTTNTPEVMDPALIRPGRLDIAIFMGYPDKKMRESIILNLCRMYNVKIANDGLINDIVSRTKWFNAAELDSLIRIAASKGKGVITEDSIGWALKKFHINYSERRLIQDNIESYASKMSNVVISYIPKEYEI
ncbi:MAG: ATP-binding protein [Ignisphaera sp.]